MERPEERPERRKNHRLRMLIDDLQSQLRDTRHALEFVRDSVGQLRVDVEDLRRAHNEERPLIAWSSTGSVKGDYLRPKPGDRHEWGVERHELDG